MVSKSWVINTVVSVIDFVGGYQGQNGKCASCDPRSFLRGMWSRSSFETFKDLLSTVYFPLVTLNCGTFVKQIGARMKRGAPADCV
jgi:hypothetical protein